jgi:chromate transporter
METEIVRRRGWLTHEEFLDGVNVASLCLMAWVSLELGRAALQTPWAWTLEVGSLLLLRITQVNSAWMIAAGAAAGAIGLSG